MSALTVNSAMRSRTLQYRTSQTQAPPQMDDSMNAAPPAFSPPPSDNAPLMPSGDVSSQGDWWAWAKEHAVQIFLGLLALGAAVGGGVALSRREGSRRSPLNLTTPAPTQNNSQTRRPASRRQVDVDGQPSPMPTVWEANKQLTSDINHLRQTTRKHNEVVYGDAEQRSMLSIALGVSAGVGATLGSAAIMGSTILSAPALFALVPLVGAVAGLGLGDKLAGSRHVPPAFLRDLTEPAKRVEREKVLEEHKIAIRQAKKSLGIYGIALSRD